MDDSPLKIKDTRVYKIMYFGSCIFKKNALKELAPRIVCILVICNYVCAFFPEFYKISPMDDCD